MTNYDKLGNGDKLETLCRAVTVTLTLSDVVFLKTQTTLSCSGSNGDVQFDPFVPYNRTSDHVV